MCRTVNVKCRTDYTELKWFLCTVLATDDTKLYLELLGITQFGLDLFQTSLVMFQIQMNFYSRIVHFTHHLLATGVFLLLLSITVSLTAEVIHHCFSLCLLLFILFCSSEQPVVGLSNGSLSLFWVFSLVAKMGQALWLWSQCIVGLWCGASVFSHG